MYEKETLTLNISLGPYDTGVDVTLEGKAPTKVYCNVFGLPNSTCLDTSSSCSGYLISF